MGNVEKLREVYRVWNATKGTNSKTWLDVMADDVVFNSLAEGIRGLEFTNARKSKEEIASYFAGLNADWEMIHFTPEEFISQGDRVVMRGWYAFKNKKTGKSFESPKIDFVRFRDGKIVEFFEFYDTAKAIAASTPD